MFQRLWDWDLQVLEAVQGVRAEWLDPWVKLLTDTGLGHVQGLILIGFMFWRKARPTAIWAFVAGAFAGLWNLIIKEIFQRDRPSLLPWVDRLDYASLSPSFTSGHTTTSFAIAALIALRVRGTDFAWLGPLLLLWAAAVGWSRVYVGVHWPTDVIGGALLGIAGAAAVEWFARAREVKRQQTTTATT